MADQYTIYIDSILRNGNNNSIVISGWALDSNLLKFVIDAYR